MSPSIEDNEIKMLTHLRSTPNSHERINGTTALSANVSSTMAVHLILRQPRPDPLLRGSMEKLEHGPRRAVTS
jgi:hypothetical protein